MTATVLDLSHWLTYEEAAEIIGVKNVKTIRRMVGRKELQKAMRKRPGLSDIAIVHPGDVMKARAARLAAAQNGMPAFVMPNRGAHFFGHDVPQDKDKDVDTPAVQDTSSNALVPVSRDISLIPASFLQAMEKIAAAAAPPSAAVRPSKRIPPDRKQLLTMAEAQELGWPLAQLQEMQKRENPPGIKIGKSKKQFRFSRAALEMELE